MRELKELCPHPSRPVGTPSPGEAGEGKDRFLSFLAFSTSPPEGIVLSFISPLQRGGYSDIVGGDRVCHFNINNRLVSSRLPIFTRTK